MSEHTSVDTAIRARRTVKAYESDPVPQSVLAELFELARWAPNHRMTEPWRFRVLGPQAFEQLCEAAGGGAEKLRRAPTLVAVSCTLSPIPLHAEEDKQAAACAMYIVMLAAQARGIASYWRTPAILRVAEGRAACGIPDDEHVLGLLHLGQADEQPSPPARREAAAYTTWLD